MSTAFSRSLLEGDFVSRPVSRRVLVSSLVAGVALAAGACSSAGGSAATAEASSTTSNAAPASPPKPIGKSLTVKNSLGSGVVTLVSVATATQPEKYGDAPKSGEFIICEMEFKGTGGEFSLNSNYIELKTPSGERINYSHDNSD